MGYLFTSESVSEGHPDKVADQISDAILDNFLALDSKSKVACETLVTTGQVILAGEVKTSAYVDVQSVTRSVINRIGYTKSEYMFDGNACGILSAIHEQSGDINRGVEREDPMNQGAGDQGLMFGYAINETKNLMPIALDLAHVTGTKFLSLRFGGLDGKRRIWNILQHLFKFHNNIRPYLHGSGKRHQRIQWILDFISVSGLRLWSILMLLR